MKEIMSRYELQCIHQESEFLENAWYVVSQSAQIDDQLQSIKILGDNLLFYRNSKDEVVALEDACPHRKLPLSMGKLVGDAVQCGYHGLTFDAAGKCINAPTQDKTPSNAFVRSYPIVEKYKLVWIWMGDPDLMDQSKMLELDNYDDPSWGLTDGGMLECQCHYLYLLDNLLDPSHVAWVHRGSFASAGTEDVPLIIEDTAAGVLVSRWIKDIVPPPYYAEMLPFQGKVDRLQYYEAVMPSIAVNMSTYARAGLGGDSDNLPEDSYRMRSYHFITPIDAHSSRYHWFQHYNTNTQDEAVRQKLNDGARGAFEEDRVVLEAVDVGMNQKKRANLDLQLDIGSRKFRKKLSALIKSEKESVLC
jgi:phenylpropionate dioxygenase-like ring-hydroxylating dioxygenase large terminal subunit